MGPDSDFILKMQQEKQRLLRVVEGIDAILEFWKVEESMSEPASPKVSVQAGERREQKECEACHEVKPMTSFRRRGRGTDRLCVGCRLVGASRTAVD
jgi:nitrate/TMAO reductase-like tetraheme cytochrome c subunit